MFNINDKLFKRFCFESFNQHSFLLLSLSSSDGISDGNTRITVRCEWKCQMKCKMEMEMPNEIYEKVSSKASLHRRPACLLPWHGRNGNHKVWRLSTKFSSPNYSHDLIFSNYFHDLIFSNYSHDLIFPNYSHDLIFSNYSHDCFRHQV